MTTRKLLNKKQVCKEALVIIMVAIIRRMDMTDEKRMKIDESGMWWGRYETIRLLMFSWLKIVKINCVCHLLLNKDG